MVSVYATERSVKPSIVFAMAADAGIGEFSTYGCRYGLTPHIDRLAKEGKRFTRANSGSAVCAPTRWVLMTGLYTGHGLRRAYGSRDCQIFLPPDQETHARQLHESGYATGGFDKWGLADPGFTGVPEKQGFDLFYGYYDQTHAHDYYTPFLIRNSAEEAIPGNAEKGRITYSHILIADETLKFIEHHKDGPFFCYAAWTPAHANYEIPSDVPYSDKHWPEMVKKLRRQPAPGCHEAAGTNPGA
jgi:arylsulfatase A-like enzyme